MRAGGFRGGSRGRRRARRPATSEIGAGKQAASTLPGLRGGGGEGCAKEAQFLAVFSSKFEIRTCSGRHFERVSLVPSYSRSYHSLLLKCPQGWTSGVRGAPRRAPTRAHPAPGSPFLLSLDSPRPDCVRPLPLRGSEAPLLGATLVSFSRGLGSCP